MSNKDTGWIAHYCQAIDMNPMTEGAEAKIYKTKMFGKDIMVKVREKKEYRIRELDERLRRERTKREARILNRLNQVGIRCPRIIAAGRFSIYMEWLPGKLLNNIGNTESMLKGAGEILAQLHENDIVHGDFTPANLMLSNDKIYLIDFGLSEFTNSIEEKALDILLMKRSVSPKAYKVFEASYVQHYKKSNETLNRLKGIEKRGRYQIRTLA